MPDYSKYDTKTLFKKLKAAHAKYYKLATRPYTDGVNFNRSPAGKELARAAKRYEAICNELEKRGSLEYI